MDLKTLSDDLFEIIQVRKNELHQGFCLDPVRVKVRLGDGSPANLFAVNVPMNTRNLE